jgi:glyoxylase-like metal-dependent hydrolase (beta-lactamase superfamily II)
VKVHHLNCGTMHVPTAPLVCHVLLVETNDALVLVDSGLGTHDCADPATRIGPLRHISRPALSHRETAAHQVEQLGFRRDDVRHIVITHFDFDHVGGISDFPDAQIHVTSAELLGALTPPSRQEKIRYRRVQWARDAKIVEHTPDGETWRGFAAAKELDEISPGIVLISIPGHTRATHAWPLTPATDGFCIAATPSIIPAVSTATPVCRESCWHKSPLSRSTER